MKLALDPDSPIPLYHQIAEAIAYRIATGRLRPGDALEPVRTAAAQLGVNLHTVRRAYAELAAQGLLTIRGARGTHVAESAGRGKFGGDGRGGDRRGGDRRGAESHAAVDRFIRRAIREGHDRHGLSPRELARRIADWSPATGATPLAAPGRADARAPETGSAAASARRAAVEDVPAISVLECSVSQCRDHAAEIEARWRVTARPFDLSNRGAPPAGAIVATFFHYDEVRRRFAARRGDLHFVAIRPDPALRQTLAKRAGRAARGRHAPSRVAELCEFDQPKALNIAADVAALLADDGWKIRPRVVDRSGDALRDAGRGQVVLFSPRAWSGLSAAEQADPRAVKVRYVIVPEELELLGERLALRPAQA